jgi:hypothetical protein
MLDLDDPIWATLRHAGGDASTFPDVLRELKRTIERRDEIDGDLSESLWDICHQWTTYDSTVAAIPHLIEMASELPSNHAIRLQLLQLIGCASAGIQRDKTGAPPGVHNEFQASLSLLGPLATASVAHVHERDKLCCLLAVIAVAQGDNELAGVLFELPHSSIQCPDCFHFTSPIEALDPFS